MKLILFTSSLACLLIVSASAAGVERRRQTARSSTKAGLVSGPQNVAMIAGPSLTLPCTVHVTETERVQWYEYGTNPQGELISDGNTVLPGHPNSLRYAILADPGQGSYPLYVYPTLVADGTYYQCVDVNAVQPETPSYGAQVVMIERAPNCTTTIPPNGIVIEGDYHTAECYMGFSSSPGIQPLMSWTGSGEFQSAISRTNTSMWSGISFTIDRAIDTKTFTCKTNFTEQGFVFPSDSATNIPTYNYQYRTPQAFVHWPPKNMYSSPVYYQYEVGQTITCFADAFPMATYVWQNMRTLEWWLSNSFTIREDMVGNQTMRCHAQNTINSVDYNADYFVELYVKPIPTTPTPGVSTTTTAVPAESDCLDLTGRWEATNPKATMCIWLDFSRNGVLTGLLKNGSDTYYADIYGRAQVNTFSQGGFSAIWPGTLGVSGHVFECRRCYGVELMTVSQTKRSDTSAASCGGVGVTNFLPDLSFRRVTNSPPCTAPPPAAAAAAAAGY
jgi:hypothetical protein